MNNTHLLELIQAFSPIERREARKFLLSPFFNTREDLVQLYDYLLKEPAPSREGAWERLFPGEPFDDQQLRLRMSYLHKLLEKYVSISEWESDGQGVQAQLAAGYRRRGLLTPFERARRKLAQDMERQQLRDAHYHQLQYRLRWEEAQAATAENPTEPIPVQDLAQSLDAWYLSSRLRLICLSAAQQGVYASGARQGIDAEILALAERGPWRELPAIAIYLHAFRMLGQPEEEGHFQPFKALLLESAGRFSGEEMRGLYLMAINYCIRRINGGEKGYFREALDLYKPGLENGFLLENGVLSRFTYHNIAAAGLQSGELDWVNRFIHDYRNALERRYRESSFSFNLARLEYARGRYGAVLELLQQANYRDPLLNLAAKTLLLKTFYELGEEDLLQSHLDAMRNYIRRKRVIGYHRANYLNIVRYAEKLLNLNWGNKKAVAALKKEIEEEEILTEREWLGANLGGG